MVQGLRGGLHIACFVISRIILTCAGMVTLAAAQVAHSASADPMLTELIARFTEHATAIDSLVVEFELQHVPGGIRSEPFYPVEEWTWHRQGEKCLLASRPIKYATANLPIRAWECYDGKHLMWMNYVPPEMEQPLQMIVNDDRSKMALLIHMAYFEWIVGNRINFLRRPLYRELQEGQARLVGQTDVGGHACFQIESGDFETLPPTLPHRFRVDLDPAADFFPRRIEIHPVKWHEHGDWSKYEHGTHLRLEVIDFRTVRDALTGRERPFPGRMHCLEIASEANLRATAIRCNEPISDEVFRPVLPPGVLVIEHFGTPQQVDRITGGEEGRRLYEQFDRVHRQAVGLDNPRPTVPPRSGNLIDAAPKRESPWSSIAVGAGVVSLVGALIALYRRKG